MTDVSEDETGDLMAELGLTGIVSAEEEKRIVDQANTQLEKQAREEGVVQMPYTQHAYQRATLKLN